jgi:targeting protein for Xklp2
MHVPEMPRKPLTEVQEFTFHADARALERAEFDQKVKEKENLYKRFRDDYETAKKLRKKDLLKRCER